MASTQHTPTELEAAGDLVLPAADELAGRFPLTPNAHPATTRTRKGVATAPMSSPM